ncbi:MAG: aldolase [Spirochaetes bacterium]|nr:aldolase [Spirochaetota bacterium]
MEHLLKRLNHLHNECGLVALKGGTEVEDMTFDEIAYLKALGEPALPLIVKIGGPDARNDMRALKSMKVEGVLAPMIESEYALKNFVESAREVYRGAALPLLAINIETITAYDNLDGITSCEEFRAISQVTVGRSDLSASMRRTNDDEEVYRVTESIIRWSEDLGKTTSVGGKITGDNAPVIRQRVRPGRINTRHMVFDLARCRDIAESVNLGLEFEIELYGALSGVEPSKRDVYRRLIENTKARLRPVELVRKTAC